MKLAVREALDEALAPLNEKIDGVLFLINQAHALQVSGPNCVDLEIGANLSPYHEKLSDTTEVGDERESGADDQPVRTYPEDEPEGEAGVEAGMEPDAKAEEGGGEEALGRSGECDQEQQDGLTGGGPGDDISADSPLPDDVVKTLRETDTFPADEKLPPLPDDQFDEIDRALSDDQAGSDDQA